MTPPHGQAVRDLWEAQRAALAEAFPAWRIICVTDLAVPLWYALYRDGTRGPPSSGGG
ncbi:hypothetical protein GCM10017673_50280 [Streptosporangium violaceochromogenes]|nr:hypothetical protein GCM10017673_50280 [Streptosporangium violaceochromogenes]